jgi:ACS family tartrate transporter-like MFS transporter
MQSINERQLMRKVSWRLLPILMAAYFLAYLDRSNIGFAQLQMNEELALTATAFGFASGIFFIGYVIAEIPSNLLLERFGARRWIARIMVTWGVIATATAFVPNAETLYVLRFLLGVAEAGLYPGILLYVTYWIPKHYRGRFLGILLQAGLFSSILGAPLSAWMMEAMGPAFGVSGWRAMVFTQGLPAIALAVVVWFVLRDRPEDAKWLTSAERTFLNTELSSESQRVAQHGKVGIAQAFRSPRVILLAVVYVCLVFGQYAIVFFLPSIISEFSADLTLFQIGLVGALPFICAGIAMIFISRSSDRTGERVWHVVVPAVIAGVFLFIGLTFDSPIVAMIAICIGTSALFGLYPVFWQLPNAFLTGSAAAVGLALINSAGNLAGFGAPFLTGFLRDSTGSFEAPLFVVGSLVFVAAVLIFVARRHFREPANSAATADPAPALAKEG